MPTPRNAVVDPDRPGIYHTISRCVRRAHLCGDGFGHRRGWLQRRLELLVAVMAIDVYAWEILSNHLHILLAIRPDIVKGWTDREVAVRYLKICPCNYRRRGRGIPIGADPTDDEIEEILATEGRVAVLRKRLSSVSWFMAKLKEPIARRANAEDGCTGHFWEGRFGCMAVLDEAAIAAVATYIDLNAVRAGIVERIEQSKHGSIGQRAQALAGRKPRTRIPLQAIPGFTDRGYLEHVDQWARAVMPGKHATPRSLPSILKRLGLTRSSWKDVLTRGLESLSGTAIGATGALRKEAKRRNGSWVLSPLRNWAG
ncbi:MAG: hypothetical protein QF561_07210 [Phycisphaerales bacterium]|nr:hypothetical protein [Phycisphaerales bacterium]